MAIVEPADVREAACSCGQLRLTAEGEPVRVSMCHCLACQRRTGSAFGIQARFPRERVKIAGRSVYYTLASQPDLIAVPVGAFADPSFPPPTISVHESRRHAWATPPAGIEREDH